MKCLYYLAPSLKSTQEVADDLNRVGVHEWLIHVIARDEAGLKREKLHSSNYLETTDIMRDGLIGAGLGLVGAVFALAAMMVFQPFGSEAPDVLYFFLFVVLTGFGAWVGGMTGLDNENRKIRRFHDNIERGEYLLLIYAFKENEADLREVMARKHPEARLAAVDRQFLNPFARLRRRRMAAPAAEAP